MAHWLFITNPFRQEADATGTFDWCRLVEETERNGLVAWNWVRERESMKQLRQVCRGDEIVISQQQKVVGFAKAVSDAYEADVAGQLRPSVNIATTYSPKPSFDLKGRQWQRRVTKQQSIIPLTDSEWNSLVK